MLRQALRSCLVLLGVSLAAHASEIAVGGVVLDSHERAVSGASIEILRPLSAYAEARAQWEGDEPAPVAKLVSDARGRFLGGVPEPGIWRLRIRARGLLSSQLDAVPVVESVELPAVRLAPATPFQVRVVDEEGNPVAGARLTAKSPGEDVSRPLLRPASWIAAPRLATTGRDGTASITGRGRGLTLTAIAPGYLATRLDDVDGDPVTLRLIRGCRRVFAVVDARHQPAAEVLVLEGPWTVAMTDTGGRAEAITPCAGERALVLATPEGQRAREVLRAANGSSSEVQFRLPPTSARLMGRVLDASTRQPLAGALVWPAEAPAAFTRSDLQGRYRVPAPTSREARLVATMDGVSLAVDDLVLSRSGPTFYLQPATSVLVAVSDEAGRPLAGAETRVSSSFGTFLARSDARGISRLKLALVRDPVELWTSQPDFLPVRSLLGRLAVQDGRVVKIVLRRAARASARVVDQDGQPVAGARGVLWPWPNSEVFSRPDIEVVEKLRALSDSRGLLTFTRLSPGKYDLLVRAAGRAPLNVPGVAVGALDAQDLGVFPLEPAAVIEGRVVDARSRPIAAARVAVALDPGYAPEDGVATGVDGRFSLAVAAGDSQARLVVAKPGFVPKSLTVEAPTHEPLTIVLEPTHRVSGSILDETGAPVREALLALRAAPMRRPSSFMVLMAHGVDADGHFELETDAAGEVTLAVEAQGYQETEVRFEAPAEGDVENLEIVLQTLPAVVEGQVRGPAGEPIPQASVSLRRKDGEDDGSPSTVTYAPWTDNSGSYRTKGLSEGVWTVSAGEPSYVGAVQELEVHAGDNRLDFRLERGLEVAGEVMDSSGDPVSGASVSLTTTVGSRWHGVFAISDDTGRFSLTGVEPGDHALDVRRKGYVSATRPVSVAGSSVSGLRILLERGTVLRGRVLGLTAKDLESARVGARRLPSGASGEARLDARGEYEIGALPPGVYTVSASASGRRAEATATLLGDSLEAVCDVEFPPGLTLTGRLVQRGGPVTATRVRASAACGQRLAEVNENGEFRLEPLDPGACRVEALDRDFRVVGAQELELSSDRFVEIELPEPPDE